MLRISDTLIAMLKSLPQKTNKVFNGSVHCKRTNFTIQRKRVAERTKNPRFLRISFVKGYLESFIDKLKYSQYRLEGVAMVEMIRAFIAFDIDSATVHKRLSEIQKVLINTGADLKLVEPQNIHVTMRFLGDISPTSVEAIYEEMKQVSFTPFDIELKGLGAFPNLRYAKVVWVGIQKGANELKSVFDQLEPRLQRLGFRPDPKGFSPHLTIARVKSGRNKAELARQVEEMANYECGTIRAEYLRLKKSVLTPKGPIYSTLKEVHG